VAKTATITASLAHLLMLAFFMVDAPRIIFPLLGGSSIVNIRIFNVKPLIIILAEFKEKRGYSGGIEAHTM
jgi:hypothetical protein